MSVTITIAGTDRSKKVLHESLRIQNVLTRKRDKCDFSVVQDAGSSYVPNIGEEVFVYRDSSKIFGGIITSIESGALVYGTIIHKLECQDFSRKLDSRLVPDTFEDQTVDQIIAFLHTTYFPSGYTINNVDCPVVIPNIRFNYKPISKCLEELADITGYDWYVDEDKDLHFFEMSDNPAPFDLEDDNGTYDYKSLVIRRDNSQIRNSITVRGGTYLAETFTAVIEANGDDFVFPIPYKFSDFQATLTGAALNVGVDYLNSPDSHDALYNFQEKILRFKEADKPSVGALMRVSGRPNLPVIVQVDADAEIAAMSAVEGSGGRYEFLIKDERIKTKEAARQRAIAEIQTYAQTMSEGEFRTSKEGLRAGMRLRINSASRSIDEYYVINRVGISMLGPDKLIFEVSLISTKSFDLIDLLTRLALADTKNIYIDENETIDLFTDAGDATFSFNETFTAQSLDYEVEFCLAPFTGGDDIPLGKKRVFIVGGSPLA